MTEILVGTDVVISTIYGGSVMDEVPLINASKAAGVKRYLPCFFATVASPKGALLLRDMVINHSKVFTRRRVTNIVLRRKMC